MSATRADLIRAKRTVRLVSQHGAIRDTELPGLLDCGWEEARTAIAVARRWGKVDYCADFLVAVSPDEGRRAA